MDDRGDLSALGPPWDTPSGQEEAEGGATHELEYAPAAVLAAWVEDDLVGDRGLVDDARLPTDDNSHLLGAALLLFFDHQYVAVHPYVSAPHDGLLKSFDGIALAEAWMASDDACHSSELGSRLMQLSSWRTLLPTPLFSLSQRNLVAPRYAQLRLLRLLREQKLEEEHLPQFHQGWSYLDDAGIGGGADNQTLETAFDYPL